MALALTAGAFSCQKPDADSPTSSAAAPAEGAKAPELEPLCGSLVYAHSAGGEHGSTRIMSLALSPMGEAQELGPDEDHDHEAKAPAEHGPSRFPAALTPDGTKLLVLVSEPTPSGKTADRLELWSLTQPGAAPEALDGAGRGAMIRNPSFAPDGSYLVFESDADSFRDIYRYDLASASRMRLTDDAQGNFEAAVGPGGQRIAFVSSRDGNAELYVMSSDGGGALRLSSSPGDDSAPRWSPDARALAFTSARERERGMDLYLLSLDSDGLAQGEARAIVSERGAAVMVRDHVWSPDGRLLAWTELAGRAGESATASLVIAELESGRELLRTQPEGVDEQAVWSPDARHLVFSRGEREHARLYRVAADGSGLAPLRGEHSAGGVEWLPRWVAGACEQVAPAVLAPTAPQQG